MRAFFKYMSQVSGDFDLDKLGDGIVLLVGLPGSGKTCLLKKLKSRGWLDFDDFKNGAIDNSSNFEKSRHFQELVQHVRCGGKCAIADIDFCRFEAREEASMALKREFPSTQITWIYFSRNETHCEANIRLRNRPSLKNDLACLRHFAKSYSIPQDAIEIPVYKALEA